MALHPIKDIKEYKRLKESLKARFESEKTGEQNLFEEQTKMLQPLIDVQKDTSKKQETALLPLTQELQRRNAALQLPQQEIPAILPAPGTPKTETIQVDLDRNLDESDKENLQNMSLDLPGEVYSKNTIGKTLDSIKKQNRRIGQILGSGPAGKNASTPEKIVAESEKQTLKIYKEILENIAGATQFVSTPKKTGKGVVDVVYYSNVEQICKKLHLLCAAKQAGNTGVDNNINAILDELLKVKAISNDEYENLHNKIFKK